MAKKAVEQTGLIPRSIIRTFDRFRKQLVPETQKLIIQEFRISRYQFLVSLKCLTNLIFIPLLINYLLKNFLLIPVTENLWNRQQPEIFLNSYQQERAFHELQKFQEKLYFDYLLTDIEKPLGTNSFDLPINKTEARVYEKDKITVNEKYSKYSYKLIESLNHKSFLNKSYFHLLSIDNTNIENKEKTKEIIQQRLQHKMIELAVYYNHQSILALTNLVGDFITFIVISLLVIYMKPEIIILKSFLTESIYSLNDTKKSFLLILGTDLLVGFHSPRGWEICLELFLRHFGFPENKDFVFLFVASFPVLLDTIFKYWIFRYLNKISPSTVATYHSMIE
jgi:CemA family